MEKAYSTSTKSSQNPNKGELNYYKTFNSKKVNSRVRDQETQKSNGNRHMSNF